MEIAGSEVLKQIKQFDALANIPFCGKCPLCALLFSDEHKVQEHLLSSHRDHQCFVKFNDVIVSDYDYFESIETAKIFLVGKSNCKISILADDIENSLVIEQNDEILNVIDLFSLLDINSKMKIEIQIIHPGNSYTIHIFQKKHPEIDSKKFEKKILEIQHCLMNESWIDWNLFSSYCTSCNFNVFEQRYLNGFFEYYYAYSLTADEVDQHYENAYSLLLPFAVSGSMALAVIEYICIKFNWITLLLELTDNENDTIFYHIAMFLSSSTYSPNKCIKKPQLYSGLYIEEKDKIYFEMVIDYLNNDIQIGANSILDTFSKSNECDKNFMDRVYLLCARNHIKLSAVSRKEIRYLYDQISSPYYIDEVEEFRRGKYQPKSR